MTLDMHASLDEALAIVKSAGYRISRPKSAKRKNNQIGPTIQCRFVDGTVTRMSVFSPLETEKLDWGRGLRLSQEAWQARWRRRHAQHLKQMGKPCIVDLVAPVPPPVAAARFDLHGRVLAHLPNSECAP